MTVLFTDTLLEAVAQVGFDLDHEPEAGRLHRFGPGKAHWIKIFNDGEGGVFGSWREGTTYTWQKRRDGPPPDAAELAALRARAAEAAKQAEAEREHGYQEAARKAAATVKASTPASGEHAYTKRKNIQPHGVLERNGQLVIPIYAADGTVQSVQTIAADGSKRFLPGGKKGEGRFWLGDPATGDTLLLAEGFATAATLREATGLPVAVCFDAGNLKSVAISVREQFPKAKIIVAGDDDRHGQRNIGREKATEAARLVNGIAVLPSFDGPEGTDWNDYASAHGLKAVCEQIMAAIDPPKPVWPTGSSSVAEYLRTPPPELQWFCRERLQANRAHLLTGIGGVSKTTFAYHLGVGAVTGRLPWGWQVARTGAALMLLAEDTPAGVHRTVARIVNNGNFSERERNLIADQLHVFPLAGQAARLLAAGPNGTLVPTAECKGLFELVKRIPDLVFIALDPALGLTEGNELDNAHQRRLGELVDKLAIEANACVVLISHAAKASNSAAELGSHSSRGGGAITDAVRGEIALRTMTADEARRFGVTDVAERKAYVQVAITKANDSPPEAFAPFWLHRGPGGLAQADLVESEGSGVGSRERKALEILTELARTSTPTLKDWRDACDIARLLTGKTDRAKEKSMERIRDALRSAGLVESGMTRGTFVPVTDAEVCGA